MEYQFDVCAQAIPITQTMQTLPQASLSMAYVPIQQWDCIYDNAMQALLRGTIFPTLDKPFLEGACPNV